MTSVNGFIIHKCPSCSGDLSKPNYSSYNFNFSGPPLSWVQCGNCENIFELSNQTLLSYLPDLPSIPISSGGFDLVGETFEEKMQDLKRQTAAFHASNGLNLNRPPSAVFVDPPKGG